MRTPLCDLLGVEFPILAFSHCRDVVAAVGRAGGFGVLGATAFTPDQLEVELRWLEEELDGRPYGVDVLIPQRYVGSDEGGLPVGRLQELIPDDHRRFVDGMMQRYEVPELPPDDEAPGGDGRELSLGGPGVERLLEVALAHPIRLVASALGPPPPDLVTRAHEQGILVAALAGSRQHALRHKAIGVDVIVAQGYEAGGHTGEIATMVLVPEVVDAVAPTPVVAAGGIARGRQMAAAMALGAQGVWTGSVWLTTEEAETHPVVKQKFLAASSSDTLRSRSMTGKPARMLRTAWTDEWEGQQSPGTLPMPLQPILTARAQERIRRSSTTPGTGAADLVTYFVGQVVGSLDQVKPARRVLLEMVEEYVDTVQSAADGLAATET
ncbi:MAG TPA: nitronate monooxygenase family protein [Acidimicrobiales bacterium]|nr:nitronate monooxygenase family protein [Acidimicrobiales bacterium]